MATIGEYTLPDDLYYHGEHFWAKPEGTVALIGMDEFGTKMAGEISFVELPMEDDEVGFNEQVGSLETGKWLGKIYSPVSGIVTEVNEDVEDDPSIVNASPYESWMFKVEMSDPSELDNLIHGDAVGPWLQNEIDERGS